MICCDGSSSLIIVASCLTFVLPKLNGGFITVFHPGKVEIPVADLKHVFDVLDDDDDGGKIQTTGWVGGCCTLEPRP